MSKACQQLHNEKKNADTMRNICINKIVPVVYYLKMGSTNWVIFNDETITCVKSLHNH